jgi:hypothetical protein
MLTFQGFTNRTGSWIFGRFYSLVNGLDGQKLVRVKGMSLVRTCLGTNCNTNHAQGKGNHLHHHV